MSTISASQVVTMALLVVPWVVMSVLVTIAVEASDEDVIPRIIFPYNSKERVVRQFSPDGVFNYTSLLLSQSQDTLYVGARDTLFALDVSDITSHTQQKMLSWETPEKKRKECGFKGKDLQKDCFNYIKLLLHLNDTHLYVCGTYAFSPACTYVHAASLSLVTDEQGEVLMEDGRSRCPFSPEYQNTAVIADGMLYTGTVSNFQGNEPTISKSLGTGASLKTDNSLNWLEDPVFVESAYMAGKDGDDQIYFFFSETGREFDFFDNTIVSRIARVCKDDEGGERVLQKKWTTFLKAQLQCSLPDDGFPYNILQDVYILKAPTREQTLLYAVFTSQWHKGAWGRSAVCVFTMEQVDNVFNGRYRELNRETQRWTTHTQPVPEPRPGACVSNSVREMGYDSSLHMPDKVLNFVKDHFLMDGVIRSSPLLRTQSVRYTQIAVQRVQGLHKVYDVMFLGTDDGRLHKAVSAADKIHIIEEIALFPRQQPIQHIELDSGKGVLFVSSYSGVVQLGVSSCSAHATCGECVLARDPYCAWATTRCTDVTRTTPQSQWQQNIEDADPSSMCNATPSLQSVKSQSQGTSICQVVVVPANTFRVLPCKLRSNHAHRTWSYSPSTHHFLFPAPEGGLVVGGIEGAERAYACWAEERGFRQLVANYCVRADPRLQGRAPIGQPRAPPHPLEEETLVLPDRSHSPRGGRTRTYRAELIAVCVLLCVCVLCFGVCVVYGRARTPTTPQQQQQKQRIGGKPTESLPLNGSSIPTTPSELKGYQTLEENYCAVAHTNTHALSPTHPPSHVQRDSTLAGETQTAGDSSPICPRPRVRLGSEIRDSIV
ncbi:semaphorin-4B-like [Engraulis encrasicolus]|uniref:semaphorin-4B-like n=1 Tax=Engraulis encrasicolus TaxID=184585 RepID=UPI002FD0E646